MACHVTCHATSVSMPEHGSGGEPRTAAESTRIRRASEVVSEMLPGWLPCGVRAREQNGAPGGSAPQLDPAEPSLVLPIDMGTLYCGDCLDVMEQQIDPESVDLIYLDPPFFRSSSEVGTRDSEGLEERRTAKTPRAPSFQGVWMSRLMPRRSTVTLNVMSSARRSSVAFK